MAKWVYLFSEGNKDMRNLLGGKGANLAEMTSAGLPVPPGFTVTTEACNTYFDVGKRFPEGMWEQVLEAMKAVEKQTGKKFGDPANPLLVSCRSGARVSMPGMMDTVLNIGLNAETLKGMVELTDNERFAWDAYRRLIQMFGNIIKRVDRYAFEYILDEYKAKTEGGKDIDLTTDMLKDVVKDFKALYAKELGEDFPDDPYEQMYQAISATFDAWFGALATSYRNAEGLPHDWGTAVNVVTMVFGNMGEDSGTGVAFTRNPITGEKKIYGEYLLNAQGEDVVAGIRTPRPITDMAEEMPKQYEELLKICDHLECYYRDVQDFEFSIERGTLWLLMTRTAKRTGYASLRFAIDFLDENLISEREAIFRVWPYHLESIFVLKVPPNLDKQPIAYGLNASPGCASGIAVFDGDTAEELGKAGKKVILIRPEITPDDVHGMARSQGVLTSRGGMTSHAAVVARGFKMPCVTGAAAIEIDTELGLFRTSDEVVREGDLITIDGTSGAIYLGEVPFVSVGLQDDPYLMRYASLVWSANSDDYVEDGVGTLWLLRDTIRDKSVPGVLSPISRSSGSSTELTKSEVDDSRYVSFIQPPDVVIRDILSTMHWHNDPDTAAVVWGIMDNLVRLLQNEVGIGNHHLAIRPLTDPEHSFVDLKTQSVVSSGGDLSVQLVGIEFFGINYFLRNYLAWGSVQCWATVWLSHSESEQSWRLDSVNPRGESVIPGSRELTGSLIVLDGKCLSIMETRKFYDELRKRELGWDWYKENNISRREVVGTLQCVQRGQPVDQTVLTKCQAIGLLTQDFQLSSVAPSLLFEQIAEERRHITFAGRELHDE